VNFRDVFRDPTDDIFNDIFDEGTTPTPPPSIVAGNPYGLLLVLTYPATP
jgi:hypothetical protein